MADANEIGYCQDISEVRDNIRTALHHFKRDSGMQADKIIISRLEYDYLRRIGYEPELQRFVVEELGLEIFLLENLSGKLRLDIEKKSREMSHPLVLARDGWINHFKDVSLYEMAVQNSALAQA